MDEPEIILMNIDRFDCLLDEKLDEATRAMVRTLRDEFAMNLSRFRG